MATTNINPAWNKIPLLDSGISTAFVYVDESGSVSSDSEVEWLVHINRTEDYDYVDASILAHIMYRGTYYQKAWDEPRILHAVFGKRHSRSNPMKVLEETWNSWLENNPQLMLAEWIARDKKDAP